MLHYRVAILLLPNFEQISPNADSSWQSKPLIFVHRLSANKCLFLPQINLLKEDKYEKLIQMTSLMVAAAGLVLAPVASAHGKHEMHPKQERMHKKSQTAKNEKNLHLKPNTTQPSLNIIKSIATNIIKMNPQQYIRPSETQTSVFRRPRFICQIALCRFSCAKRVGSSQAMFLSASASRQ